jgi:hypothetical protein
MLMQLTKLYLLRGFRYTKNAFVLLSLMFAGFSVADAQDNVRLRLYNNTDEVKMYNADSTMHTAWKPVLYYDSLAPSKSGERWFKRKFFQEHLLQYQSPGFNIYGDFIVDEYIGKSDRYNKTVGSKVIDVKTPSMNTRGYEISGNMGNKIYFETNFYENQGKFGGYVDSFIRSQYKVIPGQGNYKNIGDGSGFDFSSSSARIVYLPSKNFLFDLGYGKNFIGDGYRSLLLSENSYNYPYLHASANFGKFQYSAMWSQYSIVDVKQNDKLGYFRKWAQTYLLDWKATDRLSLGLFESVIWPDQTHGAYRGKDISPSLLSPVMFLHGSSSPSGVVNNDITGLNAKYYFFDRSYFYGQLVVNQLGKFSSISNRTGYQLGVRSGDVFEIPNLNVILEYNSVRPYTYQGSTADMNYTNANQSLAHPLGANFTEGIFVATYTYKNWRLRAEGFIANYGADSGKANYGHDVVYQTLATQTSPQNVTTGQGVASTIKFADIKLAYIINPVTNLRIEAGFTYRKESSSLFNYVDKIFYIGIRTSFRSLLYDF